MLGEPIRAFAFPVGTERQAGALAYRHIRRLYDFCFTALNGVNSAATDPFRLYRDCLPPEAPVEYARLVMAGAYDPYYWLKMARVRKISG